MNRTLAAANEPRGARARESVRVWIWCALHYVKYPRDGGLRTGVAFVRARFRGGSSEPPSSMASSAATWWSDARDWSAGLPDTLEVSASVKAICQ